jgi:glycosyltransferase involved in cell wall biosynthesis
MNKPILSILICSIYGREHYLSDLLNIIAKQMIKYDLKNGEDLEVIISKDKRGENTIGKKRNALLQFCNGEWACFIDDDDKISEDYLNNAIKILKNENPDCINLKGIITQDGRNPQLFVHELQYKEYFMKNGVYYRPPNHLNIIRTSISKNFKFPENNFGEDKEWAMNVCNSGLIKTQGIIDNVVYFYNYITNKQTNK